jgi:hypothetical protein
MREGSNPIRDQLVDYDNNKHVIIIPYFISDNQEYFNDTLEILKLCLQSLQKNSTYKHQIHLVANGHRSVAIEKELLELHQLRLIDHLSMISQAIGKVNAILSVLRNVRSSYVTITDADVLFLPRWDEHVFNVFRHFKKAAAVSPVPIFRTHNRLTANIWADYLCSKNLSFSKVEDPDAMTQYAKSIGWPWLDEKYKTKYLTVKAKDNFKAVVGNGHFCVTYNNSVFANLTYENSNYILGGNSELKYLDQPAILCDGYRLSTKANHAYHMGNKLESWMPDLAAEFNKIAKQELDVTPTLFKNQPLRFFIKFKVFKGILSKLKLTQQFYRSKGLKKNEIDLFQ